MRGDGRIFQRGPVWHVAYCLRGKEYREPAKDKLGRSVTDEAEARKFLKSRLKEVHADEIGARQFVTPAANRKTVHDLLEALKNDYKLRGKDSVQNLGHLKRADEDFGEGLAVALRYEDVDSYISERLADGDAASTINHTLQCVRQAYKIALRARALAQAPYIRKLSEEGNEREGFLPPAQFQTLLAALPDDGLRDFTAWCYATGMRKGEASRLTWNMIDGDELRVPAEVCKNEKPHTLPIDGGLPAIVKRRKAARMVDGALCEFLFHRGDGRRILEFRKTWASALQKANLPGILFHDLRRSAVRNMVQAGVSPQVAKQVSGHQSDSMFERYNIIVSDDKRKALARTEKYRKAEEAGGAKKIVAI